MKRIILVIAGFAVMAFGGNAVAGVITCPPDVDEPARQAEMDDAQECRWGAGNPADDPELQGYWPGDEWMDAGEIAGGGADGFLSINFLAGGWDQQSFTLEWFIDAEFWEMYAEAVITIHVGNGNGDPDHFAFLINPGDTEGTLMYEVLSGGGGGFSNIRLWGRGEGTSVPEPGAALLLGSGLLMLAAARRRRRRLS